MRFIHTLVICAFAALDTVGCSDSGSPTPVASVDLTPAADSVRAGRTVTLVATPRDASGNALGGRAVAWESSNAAVATVDAGVVTGVSAGTAQITAISEGQSGGAAVTVWVGITGSWSGTVNFIAAAPPHVSPLNLWIREDDSGHVTGTIDWIAQPCGDTVTVTGGNNLLGVADSVFLNFRWCSTLYGTEYTHFEGTFDGNDGMTGGYGTWSGPPCGYASCPASFRRTSIDPVSGLTAVR